MIYLAHFATHKHKTGQKLAISNGVPDWAPMDRCDLLVPDWSDVRALKAGDIGWQTFATYYWHKLDDSARNIIGEAEHGQLRDATLFCWCAPGRLCHRRVLAAWLFRQGVPVTLDGVPIDGSYRVGAAEQVCGRCGRKALVDVAGHFLHHDFPKRSGLAGLCDGVGLTLAEQGQHGHGR